MVITSRMRSENSSSNKYSNFTISLDFELRWGVLELPKQYDENILGARKAIPLMLELFKKYEVEVIWATVGFLFCKDLNDYRKYIPESIPKQSITFLIINISPLGNEILLYRLNYVIYLFIFHGGKQG